MFNEIRSQYLDALVWFNASETRLPLIRRLEEAGILIVTCGRAAGRGRRSTTSASICTDPAVKWDCDCSPRGARRVFFAVENDASRSRLRGFEDAYREAGRKLDLHAFREEPSSSVFDQIAAKLEAGVIPDAFYTHGEYLSGILELLKMHHVDTVSQCRMLAEFHTIHTPEFCGIVSEVPVRRTRRPDRPPCFRTAGGCFRTSGSYRIARAFESFAGSQISGMMFPTTPAGAGRSRGAAEKRPKQRSFVGEYGSNS